MVMMDVVFHTEEIIEIMIMITMHPMIKKYCVQLLYPLLKMGMCLPCLNSSNDDYDQPDPVIVAFIETSFQSQYLCGR